MERASSSTEGKLVTFSIEEGEKALYVRVQRPQTEDVSYKLSRSMPLRSVLLDYCNRLDLVKEVIRFTRLREDQTADQLQMMMNVIDAWSESLGGADDDHQSL